MLVAMAGLPGTGKSTLARCLAQVLKGVVLDKDVVRAALFPPPALDYSAEQDDLAMHAIHSAAEYLHKRMPTVPLFLDGRTYRLKSQVSMLLVRADFYGELPRFIECVCADDVVRQRLEADQKAGIHPAGNRTFAMYLSVKATVEPLPVPRLTLDTGVLSLEECVRRSLEYLREYSPEASGD